MKISKDYSMPIFSIPIRTKELSSSYKSLFDIIQNEICIETRIENIFVGSSEVKDGTIGDIIQKLKNSSQKISINCVLTENSVQEINKRIIIVNQIIEFESNYSIELNNQSSSSNNLELKSTLHASFLNELRNSFCGYATQVGWAFLNSFGINNDDFENKTAIIHDLVKIIPNEMIELFQNLLNVTPICHPDNFFLEESIKILSKINLLKQSKNHNKNKKNAKDSNPDSIQNNSDLIEEEEEEADSNKNIEDSTELDDSQENLLAQNIDDYSMSTDEFVSTVEHILGQKDNIRIHKSYDDEVGINRRPLHEFFFSVDRNHSETENENSSNLSQNNENLNDFNTDNSKNNNFNTDNSKNNDYSRFFLFSKSNSNLSKEDSHIIPEETLLFSLATPRKKPSFVFNSDSKPNSTLNNNSISLHMSELVDTEKKPKTSIKRSIKLDSSKKYAYTPEERRCKAKQISKFLKSSKEQNKVDNISPFSISTSPSPILNRNLSHKENSQPTYKNHSRKKFNFDSSEDDLSLLDQLDFYVDNDSNSENRKKDQRNYRQILSPDSNSLNSTENQSQKRVKKNRSKIKNV